MLQLLLVVIGLCFIVISLSHLLLNQHSRTLLFRRLGLRSFQDSLATKVDKFSSTSTSQGRDDGINHCDIFPPSRRESINDASPGLFSQPLSKGAISQPSEHNRATPIPLDAPFEEVDASCISPTGFTVEDIIKIGDFPDYATLSGVPLPNPYPEFDIDRALPRPYRPFRWKYHQTMSLTKLEPDWWIELEKSYEKRLQQRKALFDEHGTDVLATLPGSELACKELMEISLQFLCTRYPHYFSRDSDGKRFHNRILGTTTNLETVEPLHVLLQTIPEDFALMIRDPASGLYHFRAGVICSSVGWNLGIKFGLRLQDIHAEVPHYKQKMEFSMNRYFAKMPTGNPIQRGSWSFEMDQPLYLGPGGTHQTIQGLEPDEAMSRIHLRVDWQTLRRLPLSGAIVFNYKALFTPLTDLRLEPFIPSLLLKIIKEGHSEIKKYKGIERTEAVALEVLEKFEKEQIEEGSVPPDWEVGTLSDSPFYPGWEESWKRKQGFSPTELPKLR